MTVIGDEARLFSFFSFLDKSYDDDNDSGFYCRSLDVGHGSPAFGGFQGFCLLYFFSPSFLRTL